MQTPDRPTPAPRLARPSSRRLTGALGGAAVAAILISAGCGTSPPEDPARVARQAEVKQRGSSVMPFDLDRTRHVFTDLPDGGEQTVTALNAADATQIRLAREHLEEEAAKLRAGDIGDPAAIHGTDMPGLAELRKGARRVSVTYTQLDDGARLRFSTNEPALVKAIHSWFKAQSTDHGSTHTPAGR